MDYDELVLNIEEKFITEFKQAYKTVKGTGKPLLLKYLSSFYRRWHYSALIEDSILTPSRIVSELNKEYHKSCDETRLPVSSSFSKLSDIMFVPIQYSIDNHPVINDLKNFINSCKPDFEYSEKFKLSKEHEKQLQSSLSICDPFYVEYIIFLAVKLGLVKQITSIHSHRAQPVAYAEEFFEKPTKVALLAILSVTLKECSEKMNEILNFNEYITEDYLMSIIKEPITTDKIFEHIYEGAGLTLDSMLSLDLEYKSDDVFRAIISSTFFLGIIIDKYFYNTLGYYLRFIEPCYFLPIDLDGDMQFVMEAFCQQEDISATLFSPCSYYSISNIGRELLNMNTDLKGSEPYVVLPSKIVLSINSPKKLKEIVQKEFKRYLAEDDIFLESQSVYEIKIKLQNNKSFWKKIDFLEENTLRDLYMEVCYEFCFETNFEYTFFKYIDQNPFSEISSYKRKKRSKQLEDPSLKEFLTGVGHTFVLVLYNLKDLYDQKGTCENKEQIKLLLEVVKIKDKSNLDSYPKLLSEGVVFENAQQHRLE